MDNKAVKRGTGKSWLNIDALQLEHSYTSGIYKLEEFPLGVQ